MEQITPLGSNALLPSRGAGDRNNVSERAIGRTYHRVYGDDSYTEHEAPCNCYICEERPSRNS